MDSPILEILGEICTKLHLESLLGIYPLSLPIIYGSELNMNLPEGYILYAYLTLKELTYYLFTVYHGSIPEITQDFIPKISVEIDILEHLFYRFNILCGENTVPCNEDERLLTIAAHTLISNIFIRVWLSGSKSKYFSCEKTFNRILHHTFKTYNNQKSIDKEILITFICSGEMDACVSAILFEIQTSIANKTISTWNDNRIFRILTFIKMCKQTYKYHRLPESLINLLNETISCIDNVHISNTDNLKNLFDLIKTLESQTWSLDNANCNDDFFLIMTKPPTSVCSDNTNLLFEYRNGVIMSSEIFYDEAIYNEKCKNYLFNCFVAPYITKFYRPSLLKERKKRKRE